MAVRYYIAPIVEITINGHTANGSKTMLYRVSGSRHSIARFRDKDYCLCRVDAEATEQANIQADAAITLIPFIDGSGNYLAAFNTVSQVSAANRTAISNYLENRKIPTDWIASAHTIGRVLKFIIIYFNASQLLAADFPSDFTLSQTVGDVSTARRNRIRNWMDNNGIDTSDFTLSMTIRQVLVRICQQLDLGRVTLGPEDFSND